MKRIVDFFLRESLILAVQKTVSKGLTFLFFLVVAARTTQEQFGDFQLIAALLNFFGQPLIALPVVLARIASTFPDHTRPENLRWLFASARPWVLRATLAIIAGGAILDPWVTELFQLGGRGFFTLAGFAAAGTLMFYFAMGFLQADEAFRKIGHLFLLLGLVTAGAGGLAGLGESIIAFYAVLPVGLITVGATACISVARKLTAKALPLPKKELSRLSPGLASLVIAITAFFVIQTMDIIAVKLLFEPTAAGLYARLELLGKLSFVLGSSIALVLLPRTGRAFERGDEVRSVLSRGTGLYFAMAGTAMVGLWAGADFLLSSIYGTPLEGTRTVLVVLATAKIMQSYLFVLINYRGALLDRDFVWVVVAAALGQILLMTFHHGSLLAVAVNLLLTSTAAVGLLVWMPIPQVRVRAHLEPPPDHEEVPV